MTAPARDSRLKPLTELSAWLAARHAQDQETIADNLVLAFFPLWQLMRFNDLDGSTPAFVKAALPEVEKAFLQSQRTAVAFNANVRYAELTMETPLVFDYPEVQRPTGVSVASFRVPTMELPVNRIAPNQQRIPLQQFDSRDVAKTLIIEANYMTKRAMPGVEEEIMRNASVRTVGAAVRESMNAARGVTDRVVKRDRKVKGFARVTDANPCPLCAILAARGAVYGKGSFIDSDKQFDPHPDAPTNVPDGWTSVAKVHDNCRCQLRPVYTTLEGMDAGALHYKDLWDEIAKLNAGGLEGRKLRRFRINEYAKLLRQNPFDGSQFDLQGIRRDLEDRANGLLDTGLAPNDPRVRFAVDMQRQIAA